MRSVNELVPIATGTVPAHVVDQDEEYVWPVVLLTFLGQGPDQADKKQQGKEWLHTRRSKVIAGIGGLIAAIPLMREFALASDRTTA